MKLNPQIPLKIHERRRFQKEKLQNLRLKYNLLNEKLLVRLSSEFHLNKIWLHISIIVPRDFTVRISRAELEKSSKKCIITSIEPPARSAKSQRTTRSIIVIVSIKGRELLVVMVH